MIKITVNGKSVNCFIFLVMLWMLTFQSPLESVHHIFAYIDELTACIGIACCGAVMLNYPKFKLAKDTWWIVAALTIFVAVGLLGNLLFQYQPLSAVLIDLFTNLKFFFTISAGYYLFGTVGWDELSKYGSKHARVITLALFCVFLVDRVFHIWPGQIRYGIQSAQLFFHHPTYFAGAMAFLLVLLTAFYEKKNVPYLAMAVLMMAFTLRSKAMASAAVFVFFFFFAVVLKQRIKVWHLSVLGSVCLLIGLPLIWYYYFSVGLGSVRAWLTVCSIWIMGDYFPIGTGFATFASSAAAEYFSPVYLLYSIEQYVGFDLSWPSYLSDTFWPIIFGQTGVVGTCAFLTALFLIGRRMLRLYKKNRFVYAGALFAVVYLLIGSTAEPSFHNAAAVPLALMLGIIFGSEKDRLNGHAE